MTESPRYTPHQVRRGVRPDAVSGNDVYLIKAAPVLRLTYQIRELAEMCAGRGATLRIRVPATATLSRDLRRFVRGHRHVRVEKASL